MRVIIVGYMGSGKTSVGKKMAHHLAVPFLDSDHLIAEQEGKSISEIFELHGESYFRELEQQLIKRLSKQENFVLSTGGGLPCYNNLMTDLNKLGTTLFLKRPVKELAHRLSVSKTRRPLIEGKSKEELIQFIETSLKHRTQFYEKAQFTIPRTIEKPLEILKFIGINQKMKS